MKFLNDLNEAQRKAVEQTEGPVMVIAGAGSGKTRALTYRIALLLEKGVDPFNILTLTFTNKAAKEMRERIDNLAGHAAKNLWMGTFHSVFARILRIESEKIGYPSNFTIYDTQDSRNLIKTIIKELGLDDKTYKPSLVHNRISSAKNNLIGPEAYLSNSKITSEDKQNAKPRMGEIYANYNKRCFQASAMDFDDLLFKTNDLLKNFPEVLYKYQHQFQYLLVDEYQDTNYCQYLIIKRLAALNENICVVGDDAQSIYGFRGANIQNILNFQSDYPDVKVFKLEQNYRSTKNIVNAANSIIALNKDQIQKNVWTDNSEGQKIELLKARTDNEEGMMVASKIFEMKMTYQQSHDQFAILYRTNAQSRSMEEALRKRDIPYRIYGGLSFYQRKEIKDLISYFRITTNSNDEEALKRILNYPARGIGKSTEEKLIVAASDHEKSIWEVIQNPANYGLQLNAGIRGKLEGFVTMINSFRTGIDKMNAYDLGQLIASSSGILKELYEDRTPEGISRYENIQELLNGMKEFALKAEEDDTQEGNGTLSEFLQDVALLTDLDKEDESNQVERVSLMTVHLAKGLEFNNVFVVGMEENLFPSQMSMNSKSDLEEERRLFYVAVTRAKEKVILSFATSRFRWGNLIYCEPSRFVEEIDPIFMKKPVEKKKPGAEKVSRDQKTYRTDPPKPKSSKNLVKIPEGPTGELSDDTRMVIENVGVGSNVYHDRFGRGKVVLLEGEVDNQKATIEFENKGKKQLLLRFAKLKLLSTKAG